MPLQSTGRSSRPIGRCMFGCGRRPEPHLNLESCERMPPADRVQFVKEDERELAEEHFYPRHSGGGGLRSLSLGQQDAGHTSVRSPPSVRAPPGGNGNGGGSTCGRRNERSTCGRRNERSTCGNPAIPHGRAAGVGRRRCFAVRSRTEHGANDGPAEQWFRHATSRWAARSSHGCVGSGKPDGRRWKPGSGRRAAAGRGSRRT